ncbi:oxidoreductase [Selenomonas sp. WCA-380-WT-3B 3/]|uniref:Oxidoreductase n=1 Tax=Selenomonas montiformis TaxID=2652285 RepID=A0A6I2V0U8_9FIRM|nr:phage antirepressor KilAC domain-containing protein [Selenomonas montiformis]MSV25980.1 oxidoreductase [Selenomonas montiformis]
MSELIKINSENKVNGRELHKFLQIGTAYKDWFPRMVEYGFLEGVDFCSKMSKTSPNGGRPASDHEMTIGMAKEICMIQRNERGKQARLYFIECEKRLRGLNAPSYQIADPIDQAKRWIEEETKRQEQAKQITEMKPKALFADAVSASKSSILIGDLAKILKGNGIATGQKRLFSYMRDNGYLIKGGSSKNMPTQKAMERGLFEIKETTINNPDGSIRVTKTTKVTGKGQQYFVNKFLDGRKEA